ncbi:hypothetical protein JTS99_15940 [Clostridium botulinum]|nr:hypothetical protein [Clostridium botulinum]MCS4517006.1 hypothetical protein [Clostridium botulinum]
MDLYIGAMFWSIFIISRCRKINQLEIYKLQFKGTSIIEVPSFLLEKLL